MVVHDHGLLSDEALLHNIAHGCGECFNLLYLRFHRSLFRLSYRILGDRFEAEDVAQEVFLMIYEQRERFDPTLGPARTWVLQFGYYKSLRRRTYLSKRHFYDQQLAGEEDRNDTLSVQPEFIQQRLESKEIVNQALASLAPGQRKVVELLHFEGHTLKEISEMEGKQLGGIRNSYYRGIHALRAILGKSGQEIRNTAETNQPGQV